jgi:beta-ketoacyl synthase-like protein
MSALTATIEGMGLLGPGLDGWTNSAAVLEGRLPYARRPAVVPIPDGLPPAERRRLGLVVKLALNVGMEAISVAGVEPDGLPAVFASSGGDGQNCHEICQGLANDERVISPTRFHNSVHNAAAGYWSIATRSRAASNAVCAFDWSFTAGLLEAMTQVVVDQTRVLLVAYDAPYPQPLFAKRPIPEAFGVAFVLAPLRDGALGRASCGGETATAPSSPRDGRPVAAVTLGRLTLELSDAPPDPMGNAELETLRATIPAARALPLLQQLAQRKAGVVNLEYLDGRSLAVEVVPCS